MIVNLIKKDRMFSLTLPQKAKGQYWIADVDERGKKRKLISIEAINDKWVVKENKNIKLYSDFGIQIEEGYLSAGSFMFVAISGEDKACLFAEKTDCSYQLLEKLIVKEPCVISIGRNENNNICFPKNYVSSQHAVLSFDSENWSLKDNSSSNGTYLNGFRIESAKLLPGDIIYIMGLRIVIGSNYLVINNPDKSVLIRSAYLDVGKEQKPIIRTEKSQGLEDEKKFFSRSPRFSREIEHSEITIDPPPQKNTKDETSMALILGPSITMAIASVSVASISIANAIANGSEILTVLPTILMAFSMLLGATLWPVLSKRAERKKIDIEEKKRQKKYIEYLNETRNKIRRVSREQSDILNENIVSAEECVERIIKEKTGLWERVIGQNDFLRLRLGIGDVPADISLRFPEKRFCLTEDNLQNEMFSLTLEPQMLKNVPISIDVANNTAIGIFGEIVSKINFVKSLILQMVSLHSYDELKIMLICDEEDVPKWSFVKYIPHFWSDDKSIRFFASTNDEIKELSTYLEKKVLTRNVNNYGKADDYSPHFVVISASEKLSKKFYALSKLVKQSSRIGFSALFLGDNINDFPKETTAVIHINGQNSKLFDKNTGSGESVVFDVEKIDPRIIEMAATKLADIELDIEDAKYSLPNMVDFLSMYQVGKVEHLNCLTRWKENNPVNSLQAPIGVDIAGDLFYLDLHEKFHGPHGLVAGMTGSGKSEFIITYILSMAVNYHPNEVSFILIDYKGGGLVDAFFNDEKGIKLPHIAGTITNLDGSSINRSLVSIKSELERRQALFGKANKLSNEGTMDIYKYQRLYRERIVTEPCPHLFIVSDEFAELKKQQPEFMDELISTARIGRSLGVHLILATQKPSGVVDDQIWSNSKFRVCLKVQEKADSQEMIKCPDAAEIAETGRFYLQVGYNELFAKGQSAWCGADYVPKDIIEKTVESDIQIIDNIGRKILTVSPEVEKERNVNYTKQVVEIVKYLSDLASEEKLSSRSLWLPTIPSRIFVDEIERKYGYESVEYYLDPVVGEYDIPSKQKQDILKLNISQDGNSLIYGSTGSGKSSYITTLCYSLIKHHSAEELNLYILDFGSETLRMFEKAPQVGGFITASDENKVYSFFKMLKKEVESRRKLFSDYGGGYSEYIKYSGKKIPNIVVMINNYSPFAEIYEAYQDDFISLTRDGVRYGIYFVITADSLNAVRYRVQQNFKTMLTLQLNDETEYSMVVGRTEGLVPEKCIGRGLVKFDKAYEFQTAFCMKSGDEINSMKKYCTELAASSESVAKRIPVMPDNVDFEYVKDSIVSLSEVPVGVSVDDLEIISLDMSSSAVIPILAEGIYDTLPFAKEFYRIISSINKTIVIDPNSCFDSEIPTEENVEEIIVKIFNETVKRAKGIHEFKAGKMQLNSFEPQTYIFYGFMEIYNSLSEDGADKLNVLLENLDKKYLITMVFFDSQSNMTAFEIKSWYKKHISGIDGMWIGDGFTSQHSFKISKISPVVSSEIGYKFGYVLNHGRTSLIRVLNAGGENG